MTRLLTLLRRIVGRLKMFMSTFYMVVGAIMVPTSFLVYIETHDKLLSAFAFVVGLVALIWGIREIQKENAHNLDVLRAKFETEEYFDIKEDIRHKELIQEIKKLGGRQDDNSKPKTDNS